MQDAVLDGSAVRDQSANELPANGKLYAEVITRIHNRFSFRREG